MLKLSKHTPEVQKLITKYADFDYFTVVINTVVSLLSRGIRPTDSQIDVAFDTAERVWEEAVRRYHCEEED